MRIEPCTASSCPITLMRTLPHEFGLTCLLGRPAEVQVRCAQTDRYAWIGIDPWAHVYAHQGKVWLNGEHTTLTVEALLNQWMQQYSLTAHVGLPPFQGGVIGVWHYDDAQTLAHTQGHLQSLPVNGEWFAFDLVISFDLIESQAYLISTGHPETDLTAQAQRAHLRMEQLKIWLNEVPQVKAPEPVHWTLTPTVDEATYCQQVERAQSAIRAGELFQVNYTQAFEGPVSTSDTWSVFEALYHRNPAPFSGYFKGHLQTVMSTSPERYLKVSGNQASSRPIKGTAPKGQTLHEWTQYAQALKSCSKQRSENTMIVDLVRNDLSRVCQVGSVQVTQHCEVETFESVLHLVSEVVGTLRPDQTALSALMALFPAGSITGAPKLKAMEWIQALETQPRGAYCGAMGYLSFTGDLDSNVLIRTMTQTGQTLTAHAGGAVVLASSPRAEYEECLLKMNALIQAV